MECVKYHVSSHSYALAMALGEVVPVKGMDLYTTEDVTRNVVHYLAEALIPVYSAYPWHSHCGRDSHFGVGVFGCHNGSQFLPRLVSWLFALSTEGCYPNTCVSLNDYKAMIAQRWV